MEVGSHDRRHFLANSAAVLLGLGIVRAQQPTTPLPAPKKARITSSIMIGILNGSMEEKLRKIAETGIQSAEMTSDYRTWSNADADRYMKLARSYGFGFDTLMAQTDWAKQPNSMVNPEHRERFLKELSEAIAWAKRYEIPQILLMSGNEQPGMTYEISSPAWLRAAKWQRKCGQKRCDSDSRKSKQQSQPQRLFSNKCEGSDEGGDAGG